MKKMSWLCPTALKVFGAGGCRGIGLYFFKIILPVPLGFFKKFFNL
jgi:hypothetical protein